MVSKKLKKLLPWIIIGAVVIIAVIVLVIVLAFGETAQDSMRSTRDHTEPIPTLGAKVEASSDYVLVAESDTYKLYYYEPRLSIMLENKQTGAVMESTLSDEKDDGKNNESWMGYMQSGIVLTAIIGTVNTYQVDVNTVENEINTWYTDNGIYAQVHFMGNYDFELGVEVSLEGDKLSVRIPDESIVENKEGTYISTVSVFPFFGYTHLDEQDGYMFVPDGSGALIYLENNEGRFSTGFSNIVYGVDDGMTNRGTVSTLWSKYETVTQSNNVLAPVFGMAHTEDQLAYLGLVESGDERCYIEVVPNGVMVDYNRCFARFLIRDVYVQPLNQSNSGTVPAVEQDRLHSDLQVSYFMLSGDKANYSGMAVTYRDYLLEKGLLKKQDTTYNTRVDFLGTEREEFLMGTTAVTMTTADQMRDMLNELHGLGVNKMLSVYKGWQSGGLYDTPIASYHSDLNIGGNNALTEVIQNQAKQGNTIYLYNDFLSVNATTNMSTYNVMKMVNKRTFEKDVHGQVYDIFYYLLPGYSSQNIQKFANETYDRNVGNVAAAGITEALFSYSSKGSYYSRTDTMDIYIDAVQAADQKCNLLLETPNAFLWRFSDGFLDMPLSSSDYLYLDQEIPFFSIVFKGIVPTYSEYVNFEANKTENFLKMVESGMYPSFYITAEDSSKLIYTNSRNLYSMEYASYRDTIVEYDAALKAVADKVGSALITNHEVLDNGVVKVTYNNGVKIYINYTDAALTADGLTVDALSYSVQ